MSFRPLFADEDEMYIPTQKFESVFGEASGAHIGVILENDPLQSPPKIDNFRVLTS